MLKLYRWPDGNFTICSGTKQDHYEMLEEQGEPCDAIALPLDKFAVTFKLGEKVTEIDIPVVAPVEFVWFDDEFALTLQMLYPKFTEAQDALDAEGVDKSSAEWAESARQKLQAALSVERGNGSSSNGATTTTSKAEALFEELLEVIAEHNPAPDVLLDVLNQLAANHARAVRAQEEAAARLKWASGSGPIQ